MNLLVAGAVRVSLVVAAALVATVVLRRQSAALRHWLLSTALVCGAFAPAVVGVAPSWSLSVPFSRSPERVSPSTDGAGVEIVATLSARNAAAVPVDQPIARPLDAAGLLWMAWACGAMACLGTLLVGAIRLRVIARRSRPLSDSRWNTALASLCAEYGIASPVRLLQSNHASLLVTWGLRRPAIVVPCGARDWPLDRVDVVLRHELAHICRRDWATQVMALAIRSAYWFNPLVWLACARLRHESELACDDAVLAAGIEPAAYATQLLELARAMAPRGPVCLPAQGIVRRSQLRRRVAMMLSAHVSRRPVTRVGRIAAVAAVLAVTALVAGYDSHAQSMTVLSGTIVDALGRPLAGAPVVLSDVRAKATHEVRSDASGNYAFVPLPEGDYSLQASFPGLTRLHEVVALAGDRMRRNVTLRLESVSEVIRVTDATAAPGRSQELTADAREQMRARRATDPCAQTADGGCIMAPIKVKDVKPVFPESLKQSAADLVVVMKAIVGTDGNVHGIEVVKSPQPELATAAVAAVAQWQFEPTHLDGVVVETPMMVKVTFARSRE